MATIVRPVSPAVAPSPTARSVERRRLPGLGHYWTLAVEEQFYLLWPLVVFVLPRRALAGLCLAIPLVDAVIRAALYRWHPSFATVHFLGNATFARADGLALGAWLAVAMASGWTIPRRLAWCFGALSALALGALAFIVDRTGRLAGTEYVLQPLVLAVLVVSVLHIVITATPRFLEARWLVWIGTVSYGLYVIHGALGPWFRANVNHVIPRTAGLLVVSLVLAAISAYVVERPILSFKRRWPMPRA